MKKILLLLWCASISFVHAQNSKPLLNSGKTFYYDTVRTRSENYSVIHYHEVSRERKKQMIYSDGMDILNDSINKFSRLILYNGFQKIDIPTIPLENIIILEDKGVIIGLTRITASPYLIVIYNLQGKLLYKGNLGTYTLKLKKGRLKEVVTKYPALLNCIDNSHCIRDGDTCFVELSRCMLNAIGRENTRKEFSNEMILGYYVPYQIVSTSGGIYEPYRGFYHYSNPLHDLIMIGSIPYLLILNTEDGKRVNIPLVSNCGSVTDVWFDKHNQFK